MIDLDISSFLSLKQTCKFLLAVTNHRTIWLNAVQRVLEDHLITPILFLLDAMNQSALQHVALLPGRFSWLLKQPMEDDLYPVSICVLSVCFSQKQIARCNLPPFRFNRCFDIVLVPGGRFIATFVDAAMDSSWVYCIQFWDIGPPGHGHQDKLLWTSIIPSDFDINGNYLWLPGDGSVFYLITEACDE